MKYPNPIEIFTDPISLVIIGIYFLSLILETLFPAVELPKIKNWKIKGIVFFVIYFLLSTYLPLFWDKYVAEYQLLDISSFGVLEETVPGLITYETGVFFGIIVFINPTSYGGSFIKCTIALSDSMFREPISLVLQI